MLRLYGTCSRLRHFPFIHAACAAFQVAAPRSFFQHNPKGTDKMKKLLMMIGAAADLTAKALAAAVFGGAEEAGMKGCAGVFATHLHVRQNMV